MLIQPSLEKVSLNFFLTSHLFFSKGSSSFSKGSFSFSLCKSRSNRTLCMVGPFALSRKVSSLLGEDSDILHGDLSDLSPASPFLVDGNFRLGSPASPLRCKGSLDPKGKYYEDGRSFSPVFREAIEASGKWVELLGGGDDS